jgi:SAM-dependent methyltransferase
MPEFWEENFNDKGEMWGMEPARSALIARDFFLEQFVKNILIPGIGYARNAKPFYEHKMTVTGVEISRTAIELARKHFGHNLTIYHGSVEDWPLDSKKYEGIFCYALIHLLCETERQNLLRKCYEHLVPGGFMIFTAISKNAPSFGKGELVDKDRYELHKGAKIFFYDLAAIKTEFERYGLFEVSSIVENQPMYLIKCRKERGEDTFCSNRKS